MKSWVKKVVKVLAAFFAVIMFVGAFMALSNDGAVTARAEVGQAPDHTKGLTDNGDGTYKKSEWFTEADGKSYYFGTDGYMMVNAYTPDGYWIGPDGVWVPGQAATAQAASQTVQSTAKPANGGLLAVPASQADGTRYVLNRHTGKFHYPSCSSAKDIKDVNYGEYKGSRDLLINNGYAPCGKCHP